MNYLQHHYNRVFKLFILSTLLFISLAMNRVAAQNTVTVEGYVYEDLNRGFLNRVKLTLLQSDGVFVADTVSEMDGHFVFKNVAIGKKFELQFEKKVFVTSIEDFSTEGKLPNDKVFIKKAMKRLPGYFLEVTLAEKRLSENIPVDAITGARFEVYNNTTHKEELVIDSTTSNQVNVVLQQGNEYILMLRKKYYYTKRMEARVNVKGCYLCMEGFGTVNPGVVSNISSAENNNFGTLIANMDLERVDFKRNVVLQNISFESATATLRESSYRELDKVVTLLKNNPNIKLEIGAHTDSRGSDASNLKLSKERAQAALNYVLIAAKGSISPERISAKGYGESQLLNKCADGILCSEEEHARNRRVELKTSEYKPAVIENKSLMEIVHQEEMEKFINSSEGDNIVRGNIPTDSLQASLKSETPMMTTKILEKNIEIEKEKMKNEKNKNENTSIVNTPSPVASTNVITNLESGEIPAEKFALTIKSISDYSGYKVEFLRTLDSLNSSDKNLKFIAQNYTSDVAVQKLNDSKLSYMVGNLPTWGEAERLLIRIKTQYPTAHVVEYFRGKRLND